MQGGHTEELGLEAPRRGRLQRDQRDPVRACRRRERLECRKLRGGGGHDQLAAAPVGDAALAAELVQPLATGHAQPRLE